MYTIKHYEMYVLLTKPNSFRLVSESDRHKRGILTRLVFFNARYSISPWNLFGCLTCLEKSFKSITVVENYFEKNTLLVK